MIARDEIPELEKEGVDGVISSGEESKSRDRDQVGECVQVVSERIVVACSPSTAAIRQSRGRLDKHTSLLYVICSSLYVLFLGLTITLNAV